MTCRLRLKKYYSRSDSILLMESLSVCVIFGDEESVEKVMFQ